MKHFKIDQYWEFSFNTQRFDTGAATDADSLPTYRVYECDTDSDVNETVVQNGNCAKTDDANTTGYYHCRAQATTAAGYEAGKTYEVRIAATVNSVAGAAVVGRFAILPANVWDSLYGGTDYLDTNTEQWNGNDVGNLPSNFSSLSIDASGRVDLGKWLGGAPNALLSSNVQCHVNVVAANAIDATAIAADAITAAKIANGAIDAATFAADVDAEARGWLGLASANLDTQLADLPTVAEFEARTLVAAAYGTAANQTTIAAYIDTEVASILAAVDTEVAAIKAKTDNLPTDPADQSAVEAAISGLLTTQMTESYAAKGVAPTVAQAMFMLLQRLTEFHIDGVTVTVDKLDNATTAYTLTLDSDTAPTASTRAT